MNTNLNISTKISFNFKSLYKNIKKNDEYNIINRLNKIYKKVTNLEDFFKEKIIPDIYRQNQEVFETKGFNEYNDGAEWLDNGRWWKNWKKKNVGKVELNPFAINEEGSFVSSNVRNVFFAVLNVQHYDVGMLTGKMYKVLTGQDDSKDKLIFNISKKSLSFFTSLPYLKKFQNGHKDGFFGGEGVPPRKVMFIGKNQKIRWTYMLEEWVMENKKRRR